MLPDMSGWMARVNIQATLKAAGKAVVLLATLAAIVIIVSLRLDRGLTIYLTAALFLFGTLWTIFGGEQGTSLEYRDSQRKLSVKNLSVLDYAMFAMVRTALETFTLRAPLPPPAGEIRGGSPANQANIIEGRASLPPAVKVAEIPIEVPPDAGHLP